MAIQRAVVFGTIGSVVQIRSMFTAEVTESGGDDAALLWGVYLEALYSSVDVLLHNSYSTYQYELQARTAGHWVPFDVEDFAHTGANSGDPLPNAVSVVLIAVADGLRHVGRKFLGPISEISNVGNYINAGTMVNCAACLLDYISPVTGIGGGTLQPGILGSGETFHPFVGGSVSSLLGSMRRRKPGNGI